MLTDTQTQSDITHHERAVTGKPHCVSFSFMDWLCLLVLVTMQLGFWQIIQWQSSGHVDWRTLLIRFGAPQAVIQIVFFCGYHLTRYLHTAGLQPLLITLHLLVTGGFIFLVAHHAWPYCFELGLFYLPLVFISYERLHLSAKLLIFASGSLGYLIVLVGQSANYWFAELPMFELVELSWHWLALTSLLAFATGFSHKCAKATASMKSKERQLKEAMQIISELTVRDKLTGLYNKRFLIKQLEKLKAIADRGRSGFVLGILAIDHYEELRQNHSQGAADAVIKAVADTVEEHIRHLDFCARWSDSTFAIVLENAEVERTKSVFERICQSVADHSCYSYGIDHDISVCVGVTQYSCVEDWQNTLARAEEALQAAQERGIGQVSVLLATSRQVELVRDEQHRLKEKKYEL